MIFPSIGTSPGTGMPQSIFNNVLTLYECNGKLSIVLPLDKEHFTFMRVPQCFVTLSHKKAAPEG